MEEYEPLVVGKITPRTLQTLTLEYHETDFLTKHLQSY